MAGPKEHDPVSQVLMNDDLLWIIFQLVKLLSGGKLAGLSSFPRVCRAFSGPATRVIWSELDGMMPLWHLLAPIEHRPYRYYARALKPKRLCSVSYFVYGTSRGVADTDSSDHFCETV